MDFLLLSNSSLPSSPPQQVTALMCLMYTLKCKRIFGNMQCHFVCMYFKGTKIYLTLFLPFLPSIMFLRATLFLFFFSFLTTLHPTFFLIYISFFVETGLFLLNYFPHFVFWLIVSVRYHLKCFLFNLVVRLKGLV